MTSQRNCELFLLQEEAVPAHTTGQFPIFGFKRLRIEVKLRRVTLRAIPSLLVCEYLSCRSDSHVTIAAAATS